MLLSDLKERYKCDECGYMFDGKDVKLEPYPSNIQMFFRSIYVVDEEGKIIQTMNPKSTDKTLNCPKCNYTHLLGFNKV